MDTSLAGKRVAFLFTDGVEQSELLDPLNAVRQAGAETVLVSPHGGGVQMVQHDEKGDLITTQLTSESADPDDFDALVLPGGVRNPDSLRTHPNVIQLIKDFAAQGKPVAAICHGPWLLVEADLLRGRTATSWPSIRTDLRNAGANVVDEAVAVDENIITSRKPDDVEPFTNAVIDLVENAPEVSEIHNPREVPA